MSDADSVLPLLAVVYGPLEHEQPIEQIVEAARGVCRLLWVLPHDDRPTRTALRVRRASVGVAGEVADVSAGSVADAAALVRAHGPAGVTCFTDENIVWTADLAEKLGLPYHSRRSAARLTDKLEQRRAFRAHGLPTPPFWDADDVHQGTLQSVVETAGFPLVLKPRGGFGSVDTESLRSIEELRVAAGAQIPGRMIVEGFIPDPSSPPFGAESAPYVCVDIVAGRGSIDVLGITGRLPVAEPFRESGSFFPADISDSARAAVIDAALAAVAAVGADLGVMRVEVKWTDLGPVVIEVNGRPDGGSTRDFLARAVGVDTFQVAMKVALGLPATGARSTTSDGVQFRLDLLPDVALRRIDEVQGLDEALGIAGVERVVPGLAPGDEFSWRDGSFALVATVLGTAPDHRAVHRIRDEVYATVVVSGST